MVDYKSLKTLDLFASMEQRELDRLAQRAADIALKPSEWLVREDERMHFFVVLEGTLQLAKQINGREIHLTDLKMGDFFGEVPLLLGLPSASSLQAKTACRVARFEAEQLRELIQTSSACSEKILRVVKERMSSFQDYAMELPPPRVLVVGSQHDANCQAVRNFLTLNRISHEWITRETERIGVPASLPVESNPIAALIDGAQWVTPPVTVRTVARALGYRTQASSDSYDVVIVGGGPAGLAAAIYGASEGLKVLLIERNAAGGQAGNSTRIENYLGFPYGVSGDDLSERAVRQSIRFGSEIVLTREVRRIQALSCGNYRIEMDGDDWVKTKALILATGVDWRLLKAKGVAQFIGRGVFYGASRAESSTVAGKDIFIVGGGNSAGQAAIFYADYARSVTVLVRGGELKSNMSQYLIENITRKSNVAVETSTELVSVGGEERVEHIRTLRKQEESVQRKTDCIFVMIGANAATEWLPPDIERDQNGYICTGRDVSQFSSWNKGRLPLLLETSLPGIFCAGDVRHGSIKRVSSAAGEGGIAIASIHQYLAIRA